jgi:hypothetical protein
MSAAASWSRASSKVMFRATDDEVDEASVEQLLEDRSTAKLSKDYKKADEIAQKLQNMGIAYVDEKKLWYTKKEKGPAPKQVAKKKGGSGNKKKRSSPRSYQGDRKRTRKK